MSSMSFYMDIQSTINFKKIFSMIRFVNNLSIESFSKYRQL
jgi:hypothetical protein